MVTAELYRTFADHVIRTTALSDAISVLSWDQRVCMPKSGAKSRAEEIAALSEIIHVRKTTSGFVDLVRTLSMRKAELSDDEWVNVRETLVEIERALKVPKDLVLALKRAESETYSAWVSAREQNSYAAVKDKLKQLLQRKIEYATAIAVGRSNYDALLDLYEAGTTAAEVEQLFSPLRSKLPELVTKIAAGKIRPPKFNFPENSFPKERQKHFLEKVISYLGFDLARGRFDETVHPFAFTVGQDDTRLTTRFDEQDILGAFLSTVHETGHGLYDQGLDPAQYGFPKGDSQSLGIHESQSLLWENNVGRSQAFWKIFYPKLSALFPRPLGKISESEFVRHINTVEPTLIRVDADEVTYGLHIIIRFELEQALIAGTLSVEELPNAWNEKYQRYLGITPPSERLGVLQDVHWYSGSFGYFPVYLLGAMYAAQLFAAFEKTHGEFSATKESVDLLLQWLRENIHLQGKRYKANELIQRATGAAPSSECFVRYLEQKYNNLYF